MKLLKQFRVFQDLYYWKTAILIARNQMTRQYRNSFFGMLWTLMQPLTMAVVYCILMPSLMRFPVANYALYISVSLPLWTFMSASLIQSSNSLLSQNETLKRCIISTTVFPVADVLRTGYIYLLTFGVMYGVALLYTDAFSFYILLVPLYWIPILLIMACLCVSVSYIAPYVRDIADLIVVGMNMVFWLTPVIYPISAVPAWVQFWMRLNPFYIMMRPLQNLLYEHRLPDMAANAELAALAMVAVALTSWIYSMCGRNYVYYL